MSDENESEKDLESIIANILGDLSMKYSEMNSKLDSLLIRIREKKEKKESKSSL